jgi:deazaflavin-dependent oxidoreductase (nitroreductase family)
VTNPNDAVITEFRGHSGSVTQAMGGALAGLELVLLHDRGRRSGAPYITPVACMSYENGYLLLGSFAGADAEPQWVRNVEHAAQVTVETATGTATMTAAVLRDGPERDRLYGVACEHWPFVLGYEQRTSRPFPVVRLTPGGIRLDQDNPGVQ